MRANLVYIDIDILYLVIAITALIVMLVCIIKLIAAKKEKRRQMKKAKIAAVISAPITAIIIAFCTFLISPPIAPPLPEIAVMPDLTGFKFEECKSAYTEHFDLVVEKEQYYAEYPKGTIISHTPKEGQEYLIGRTTVKCFISRGPRMVAVSNVIGLDFEDAKEILGEYDKFTVGFVNEYSDDVPKGKVIATDPPAREKAVYGSAVKVTVSGGKEPDVTDDDN